MLSGTKTLAVGSYWSLILQWSATQNISNNTSFIEADLYWQGSAISSSAPKDVSITIDGATARSTATAGLSQGQKKLIYSTQKTVSHNSAGAKSVAISGTFDMGLTLGGNYVSSKTVSGTWALDTIARQSTFGITDKYLDINEAATVRIVKASSSFTHSVTLKCGSYSYAFATKTTATEVTVSPYEATLNQFRFAKMAEGSIEVETFNGNTSLGTSSTPIYIYATQAYGPTIDSFTVADLNAAVATLMGAGKYVQGQSNLRFNLSGSGQFGATVESTRISFNGSSTASTVWNYGVINRVGTTTATATITDTRGFTTTQTLDIVVSVYNSPTISSFRAVRNGTTPTTVNLNYVASFTALGSNSISVSLQHKLRTATTWTTISTLTTQTGSASKTGLSTSNSYDFRIVVSDYFTSNITSLASVSTSAVLMDLAQTGIGIGKMWEQGALDVAGLSYFNSAIYLNGRTSTDSNQLYFRRIGSTANIGTIDASTSIGLDFNSPYGLNFGSSSTFNNTVSFLGSTSFSSAATFGSTTTFNSTTNLNGTNNINNSYLSGRIEFQVEPITSSVESGYCGLQVESASAATAIGVGYGVNFRTTKTYTPASITLSRASGNLDNAKIYTGYITNEGFWFQITRANSSANAAWRGRYTA